MNVFDIIGPVMIGPSSSHTAGAARAGAIAARLLGAAPKKALVTLYGSFSHTYAGHGTDIAVIGGILGFSPSDARLKDSFEHAKRADLEFEIRTGALEGVHPNTMTIELWDKDKNKVSATISSVGGGKIQVVRIDDADVLFSAEYNTTIVFNEDRAGVVAQVSSVLAEHDINIAFMRLFRQGNGSNSIMVIESDQKVSSEVLNHLRQSEYIKKVVYIEPF